MKPETVAQNLFDALDDFTLSAEHHIHLQEVRVIVFTGEMEKYQPVLDTFHQRAKVVDDEAKSSVGALKKSRIHSNIL